MPRVGWLCSYTPVEVITAVGLTPVRLLGSADKEAAARGFLPVALCPYLKSALGTALMGEEPLDGIVVAACCDGLRRLADVWARYVPGFVYTLDVPRRRDEAAIAYFRGRLVALAQRLGERYGVPVSEEALGSAIAAYNQTRRLLAVLDDLRARGIGLPAGEMQGVWERASREALATFQPGLEELLARLQGAGDRPSAVPVVVSGNVLAPDDKRALSLIEELGGRVVGDDLCSGTRWLAGEVDLGPDPYLALARRYLERVPCARMLDAAERYEELVRLCRRTGARGVIYLSQKFCDTFLYDFGPLRERLQGEGIRTLLLELDGTTATLGQSRTRVEAFLEVL